MKLLSILFFALVCSTGSYGQMVTLGTEFFVSLEAWGQAGFSLVSKDNATVTIHFFADPDLDTTFTLTPGVITQFPIDYMASAKIADHVPGEVDHKSAVICSDLPLTLTFGDIGNAIDDVAAIYPVIQPPIEEELYYMNTRGGNGLPETRRAALIVSHYDDVMVEIIPKVAFAGHPAGEPFEVTLNRGETYSVSHLHDDESGSTIRVVNATYNHPISVYSSSDAGFVALPWDALPCCADITFEQMMPVSMLDTIYHFVPFLLADGAEAKTGVPALPGILRIVSAEDNNTVRLDGTPVALLNAGDIYDTLLFTPAVITGSGKLAASEFAQSREAMDSVFYGDPDQLWLIPLKKGIHESYFNVWDYIGSFGMEFLATITIIADANNNDIQLNDINISGDFLPFPGDTRYKYLQRLIDKGIQYHLVSPERVAAYFSAFYAYGGISYALSDIATRVEDLTEQPDTLYICDTTTLTGVTGMSAYLWSTGATTASISVSESGTYWVQSAGSCSTVTDTFQVAIAEIPRLLPADTLCNGEAIVLNVYQEYFTDYLWSTGDTTPAITVSEAGTYMVTVHTEYCSGLSDTFNIYVPAPPVAILPGDTLLCKGIPLSLNVYQDNVSYRWSTGQTDCCITTDSSGLYWAAVTNFCGETASDSVQVSYIGCTDCLLIPTAFSPNGDGLNDKFMVQTTCLFDAYRLAVFNRYGQRIFISYDPEEGWDGTYNGLPADVGVYFYQVEATHFIENAGSFREKGDLTLIR